MDAIVLEKSDRCFSCYTNDWVKMSDVKHTELTEPTEDGQYWQGKGVRKAGRMESEVVIVYSFCGVKNR